MSILVFDPAYSRYMIKLGKRLAKLKKTSCEAVLSSNAYRVYCYDLKCHVYYSRIQWKGEPKTDNLTSSDIVWGKDVVSKYRASYFGWLKAVFKGQHPELCIFHNEKFLLCTLAIELCEEYQIPYVVLERGAFRPFTTTCDLQGTNANARFRQIEHDPKIQIEPLKKQYRLDFKRSAEKAIYTRFGFFLLIITFENFLFPGKRYLQHKKFSILEYARVSLGFLNKKVFPSFSSKSSEEKKLPKKYVFVPLQRPGDTQLTFSNDFPGMQEFIDLVVESVRKVMPEVDIVFKQHPYDIDAYDFHGCIELHHKSSLSLIKNSSVVLNYNSTVGFESLVENIPVVCLGESFYTKGEYVYKPFSMTVDAVSSAINKAMLYGSKVSGDSVMANVLVHYQVSGSMYRYDSLDIDMCAAKILNICGNPSR
ncbi:capsular polysaccharide biosynthesis protein [Kushneria sinocarnis]|uniref:Capsular polysaccharide biosynthesis protein n=1 Tax=Kushneria sinocarnis TaxID=595502 RepID=A0A420WWZ8_9GAMM|nr:hypothetical protein [Kushneria sinocarnis]RKR04245.1 capsular polysaccharide biosynthesis protein [Kushneria sinocarnis]